VIEFNNALLVDYFPGLLQVFAFLHLYLVCNEQGKGGDCKEFTEYSREARFLECCILSNKEKYINNCLYIHLIISANMIKIELVLRVNRITSWVNKKKRRCGCSHPRLRNVRSILL